MIFGTWKGGTREAQNEQSSRVLRKLFGSKRDKVIGEWRRLHSGEFYALYSSPNHCSTSRNVAGSIPESVIGII